MFRQSGFNVFTMGARTVEQCKQIVQKIEAKTKGTFMEKGVIYVKTLYKDYTEVAVSVRDDIKQKPLKAACIFTGMGLGLISLKTNPNEQSFRAKFIECSNDVSMISPSLVNPAIVDHLTYIQKCYNKDLIRRTSFGLFSVIWVDRFSKDCDTYQTNCSYLQMPYSKFPQSIIDVGFWNIWWVISRRMIDYDINY